MQQLHLYWHAGISSKTQILNFYVLYIWTSGNGLKNLKVLRYGRMGIKVLWSFFWYNIIRINLKCIWLYSNMRVLDMFYIFYSCAKYSTRIMVKNHNTLLSRLITLLIWKEKLVSAKIIHQTKLCSYNISTYYIPRATDIKCKYRL